MVKADEWSSNANEVLTVSLVRPSSAGLKTHSSFLPEFTYPIFGDDETIYGYQGLKIHLRFRATDMRPHLNITHDKKIRQGKADDVQAMLQAKNHLPKISFLTSADFDESSRQSNESFVPPGELHHTMNSKGGTFEIWKGSLAQPAIRHLMSRIQIFVTLFIEGGSYIIPEEDGAEVSTDADSWTVFLLYHKSSAPDMNPYVFAGFATVHRFFYFQGPTAPIFPPLKWELQDGGFDLSSLPCRTRLSQFIILPPFQRQGIGAGLYRTMYQYYLEQHPQTLELTVEDPNEAFDAMRDIADLTYLRTVPEFAALRINVDLECVDPGKLPTNIVGDPEALLALRKKVKIVRRQFSRVLEMHLMSKLPDTVRPDMEIDYKPKSESQADRHEYRLWQLFVKERLLKANVLVLGQLEPPKRLDKLNETLECVELEYARLLEMHKIRSDAANTSDATSLAPKKKRRLGDSPDLQENKRAKVEN